MALRAQCNARSVDKPAFERHSSRSTSGVAQALPREGSWPRVRRAVPALILMFAIAAPAAAQAPEPSATDLAKQTQNPVASLTSLPFQFNFNGGGDLKDQTLFNTNFQPVIPFKINAQWNGIARTIVPINSVPTGPTTRASGIGDIQEQFFLSPAHPGKIIWGVGPMFSFPTATVAPMQTGTWALGPGAVLLTDRGPWVIGGLFQQFWPISDVNGDPKTDLFVMQPFVNYNFGEGWALALAPLITANWNAASGQQWTVPLGAGISKVTVLGTRPMNVSLQYYYNVKRPDGSAGFQLRFAVSLLYPHK